MESVKGKTRHGFEFEIDRDNIDMELLDTLADAMENESLMGRVLSQLMGKEQKKRFYDFIRNEKGKVPIDKASEGLIDIFNSFKDGKNS